MRISKTAGAKQPVRRTTSALALLAVVVAGMLPSTVRAFRLLPAAAGALQRAASAGMLLPCPPSLPSDARGSVRCFAFAKGRPSLDDVERLSRGQAAKKRGTGSRAICHRLNEMERKEFELAKKMGFVQLRGTGYRRERKGSPLANIHRQLCDAMARPCVEIHRGLGTDAVDEVVVDVSTLRPITSDPEAVQLLQEALLTCVAVRAELLPGEGPPPPGTEEGEEQQQPGEEEVWREWEATRLAFEDEDWETKPIWDLPVLSFVYRCAGERSLAKQVAQAVMDRTRPLATRAAARK